MVSPTSTHYTLPFSSGNFSAFVKPRKPDGVDEKKAYFIGSGLASLAGAVFLIRDGQMDGKKITIMEMDPIPGGALDGMKEQNRGFVIRGGRELENHYECLWDLFRSIPSLEVPGASVLDEVFYLNKDDPNYSRCRVTHNRGEPAKAGNRFDLTDEAMNKLRDLFMANSEDLEGKTIEGELGEEFLESNFWLYWQTMFGYEKWHSALEMKLYLHRFIHHVKGLPNLSTIMFTKYNQYESFVMPLVNWLQDKGVNFEYGKTVTHVNFKGETLATRFDYEVRDTNGNVTPGSQSLGPNDLLFITNGSLVDNSDNGDHHTAAKLNTGDSAAWDLWRSIAIQSPSGKFGNPDVFGARELIPQTKWMSCTVTCNDRRIPHYIEKVCKRDPYSGKIVTGGIVTVRDSNWLMSWTVNRQPHFKAQTPNQIVAWVYGLYVDVPGNYVKKTMQECTGKEIVQEWLYHMGVLVAMIEQLSTESCTAVPTMMPYVTALFMPRKKGDRPDVIPEGAVNFAFMGQFAQSKERDCVFTTEYSVRTAMEAVYGHLNIERPIPEVFNSTYDARAVCTAITAMRDGRHYSIPGPNFTRGWLINKIQNTSIGRLIISAGVLPFDAYHHNPPREDGEENGEENGHENGQANGHENGQKSILSWLS